MFSWGEDCHQGFRVRAGSRSTGAGVHFLNLSYGIRDLSAGHSEIVFTKTCGDASIIRSSESNDGRGVWRKQKFVECKEKIQAVSCGDDVVTLLSERGAVFCVDTTPPHFTPTTPKALCDIAVSQVACGSRHSIALTKDGQVYTWGQGSRGQLGLGEGTFTASSPQQVQVLSAMPLVQIAAGGEQSFALSVSGGVFSWGRNDCGQLGLGDTTDRNTPTHVDYLNMKKTIHVSCGKDHTAILTKDGIVFTFGSGQYGQLGHNSFRDEPRPRILAELWGAKVTKIACGRYHTLVLTDSNRVYSFGHGEQGQLGHLGESHPSVPQRVHLPTDTNGGIQLRNIFAGGNCSFATSTSNEDLHHESNTTTTSNVSQHSIDNMIDRWTSKCDSKSWKEIKQEIHRMFSSASCLNQSFLDRSREKHFQTSPSYSGLDLSLAQVKLEELMKRDNVLEVVVAAVLQMLPSLDGTPLGVEGLRVYLLLNGLLHVTQECKWQQSTKLADALAAAMLSLPAQSLQVIGDWWSSQLPNTKVKYVKVWKQALSMTLSCGTFPCNSVVSSRDRNLLLVLQQLYNANNMIAGCQRIPENTFCLGINSTVLQEDLRLWRSKSKSKDVNDQPLFLINFPFVMDLNSKITAFNISASWTQKEHQTHFTPFGWVQHSEPFFGLKLKRASLLEGTFEQLDAARCGDFKKPLVVYFDEDPKVTDVYKRDLFHHLFKDMVSTQSGMFKFNDSETLAWFPSKTTDKERKHFYLFGVLCGLALYNQCIIHLPFPLALFKKLLDVKPSLEDMLEFEPFDGQRLQKILDNEGDDLVEQQIEWVDLDPQNPGKLVTNENKKEFVHAYVNHAFNTSVESVFQEFKRGFFQVCEQDLVKLFRPEELRGVMVGKDVYDWAKLKQNTRYEPEYHVGHPTIQMFWEVFHELTEEQKKDFLWFLTGYRRVPILGMDQIHMIVQVKQITQGDSYDKHLPESLTCYSILQLPLYSTKSIMQHRLIKALTPQRGFRM